MVSSDPSQFYRESGVISGTETDCVDYNVSNYFLLRISRANFENNKLLSQFTPVGRPADGFVGGVPLGGGLAMRGWAAGDSSFWQGRLGCRWRQRRGGAERQRLL